MHISPLLVSSTAFALATASSLWVENAPDYVRPYAIEHYATAQAVAIGAQIYRFPVTGASSGGKFSLLSTASCSSGSLGVLPHIHEKHYENFFAYKGRFQLWTEKDGTENGRLMTAGDYGAAPRNTTHTFQIMGPDTEMVGVISPGGFEDLFFFLADSNYTSPLDTPFVPAASNDSAGSGSSSSIISELEDYDVYAKLTYSPRRDFVNGSAPESDWHKGSCHPANNSHTPFFIANNYGPKKLNSAGAFYQLIQPFVTPMQSGDVEFTQGTITISRLASTAAQAALPYTNLTDHTAFEVLEGALNLEMQNETVQLIGGDVAFIPGGTPFRYWSQVALTKFMYVGSGTETLDVQLMASATSWDYAVFPTSK